MSIISVERIIANLGKYTVDERLRLLQALRAYSSVDVPLILSPDLDLDCDLVLSCLCTEMQSMGVEFTQWHVLKKGRNYSAFQQKVPGLMKYLRNQKLSKTETQALMAVGMRLLYRELTREDKATSSWLMMMNINRIPSLFNRSFPGYAKSGVLGMIVR